MRLSMTHCVPQKNAALYAKWSLQFSWRFSIRTRYWTFLFVCLRIVRLWTATTSHCAKTQKNLADISQSPTLHAWTVLDKPLEMTLALYAYVFFLFMWHHSSLAAWSNCMVLANEDRVREQTVSERRLTFHSFVSDNMTGSHSLYTIYEGHEIMFHVSTMLPFTPDNPQQVTNMCY